MKNVARKAVGLPHKKRTAMKIESRKSISLERAQNGTIAALHISGQRYEINGNSFEMPEQIAEQITLKDLDFDIRIDIEDQGTNGIVSEAIIRIPKNEWSVIMMVRHTLGDWNKLKSLSVYEKEVEDAVKERDQEFGDVFLLQVHNCADHFFVVFAIKVSGLTVKDLLENARTIAGEFLPLLI